ncbi:hypothetical protein GGD65_007824 [Bradyrhizobium sp. CIR18]|uniref:hypothetical protein n=1 Tax=Bradyrhizobium sp. CIR18 TaxID=2663839 RepID=UPI0016059144|nr:hypothetical protein [Bradyrhizobium sp. CIR18]MBB4366750.1 hypothetical protein [Bradyrhizobium sp. CIR18]
MQRVDAFYLYSVGGQLRPLSQIRSGGPDATSTYGEAFFPLLIAEGALEPLLYRSIFRIRTSLAAGQQLLHAIRTIKDKSKAGENDGEALDWLDSYHLSTSLSTFESVLQAELALMPLYVVMPKAGYDVTTLIEAGSHCFPAEVMFKVPEAINDLREGTRCLAFKLNTAAGFHLHRANEAVLRKYWDVVSDGAPRPVRGNMGDYLNQMKQNNFGNENVRAALEHLVKFHRNPLMHPDQSLQNSDDAIALMNGIHTAMVQMLKAIPLPEEAIQHQVGGMPAPLPNPSPVLPD